MPGKKKLILWMVLILLVVAAVAVFKMTAGVFSRTLVTDNLIRLHVIANSDTVEDQQLKREVRDAILTRLGKDFAGAQNMTEARVVVEQNLDVMEKAAAQKIAGAGKNYSVQAQFGRFEFPTRSYGDINFPAGTYQAVRVVIGDGKGENWWCVLFPPLCLVDIAGKVSHGSPSGVEVTSPALAGPNKSWLLPGGKLAGGVELRLKFLEVWNRSRGHLVENMRSSVR